MLSSGSRLDFLLLACLYIMLNMALVSILNTRVEIRRWDYCDINVMINMEICSTGR